MWVCMSTRFSSLFWQRHQRAENGARSARSIQAICTTYWPQILYTQRAYIHTYSLTQREDACVHTYTDSAGPIPGRGWAEFDVYDFLFEPSATIRCVGWVRCFDGAVVEPIHMR